KGGDPPGTLHRGQHPSSQYQTRQHGAVQKSQQSHRQDEVSQGAHPQGQSVQQPQRLRLSEEAQQAKPQPSVTREGRQRGGEDQDIDEGGQELDGRSKQAVRGKWTLYHLRSPASELHRIYRGLPPTTGAIARSPLLV